MPTHATLNPIETTKKSVGALLTAIDGAPTISAATAYRAAITRYGRHLVASVGPSALDAVLDRLKAEAPDKVAAEHRTGIVSGAWASIG